MIHQRVLGLAAPLALAALFCSATAAPAPQISVSGPTTVNGIPVVYSLTGSGLKPSVGVRIKVWSSDWEGFSDVTTSTPQGTIKWQGSLSGLPSGTIVKFAAHDVSGVWSNIATARIP
jgi:hypothetical protein